MRKAVGEAIVALEEAGRYQEAENLLLAYLTAKRREVAEIIKKVDISPRGGEL